MSYLSVDDFPDEFIHMPAIIRRQIEVAEVARFGYSLIDLTENHYYENMGLNTHRDFQSPILYHSFIVATQGCGVDCLDSSNKETVGEVKDRVRNARKLFIGGSDKLTNTKHYENVFRQMKDRSEPAKQMFVKAVNVFGGTFTEIRNCLFLAEAVRALDEEEFVKSNHVAEAIQYAFPRDTEDGIL